MKKIIIISVAVLVPLLIANAYAQYMGNVQHPNPNWPPVCLGGPSATCPENFAAMYLNNAIGEPFGKSDLVLVGKIIEANEIQEKTQYSVKTEFFLKGFKSQDLITANGILPEEQKGVIWIYNTPIFQKDDRVFLYLKQENGRYNILDESFAITKKGYWGPPEIIEFDARKEKYHAGEKIPISGKAAKAMLYFLTENGPNKDVKIKITNATGAKILEDTLDIMPSSEFSYDAGIALKNARTGYYDYTIIIDGTSIGISLYYVSSPLDQRKEGIPSEMIMCKENYTLIQSPDGRTACVKEESKQKFLERGWSASANKGAESSRHCSLAPDPGMCKASIEKFYFDWESFTCKPFRWGGCGGVVPFDTLENCQVLCN